MDTSAKLAQRHVPALRDRRRAGAGFECLALVIAGWIRYLAQHDENGAAYSIEDPLAGPLTAIAATWHADPRDCVERFLAVEAVFGDVGRDSGVREAVTRQLERIGAGGVRAALRAAA
jgi:fructuronate reductase